MDREDWIARAFTLIEAWAPERTKCLTVTDDYSHECVDIAVDHGIGGE